MEDNRGPHRGSYIWGRSVHNTRIERLWYDVTHGFGLKWKTFFYALEVQHALNPQIPGHIWLLHHLFMASINEDASEWAETWNNHKMQLPDSHPQSPRQMFFFSQHHDGRRGLAPPAEVADEEELPEGAAMYGIDWEAMDDPSLMDHFLENNPDDVADEELVDAHPPHLSHVECESPNCPLAPQLVIALDTELAARADLSSRNMNVRRHVWIEALNLYSYLIQQ
ncbi:hypothetical protein BD626DRAFT_391129 [Schizophyllum amplum]|uniref:Integrase core domain-containing protein n=1 Tax=Schizophyllum amplum TaxID=97359 RepID=A0A550CZ46_9AGAR|nr:hypothetical protein BD626DRAFT_391129 [Auriculariopsis ampla]